MAQAVQSTERTYYRDTYLETLDVKVLSIGNDELGNYLIFDKTLFHPQGGGQPDDKGWIEAGENKFEVVKLVAPRDPNENPYVIRHYFSSQPNWEAILRINSTVKQKINMETRLLNARYHSGGHILSNAVNTLYPQIDGCRGNHINGQAFVLFEGPLPADLQKLKADVLQLAQKIINDDLPLHNGWNTNPRTIQFGTLKAYPCGGTHVGSTSQIGTILIRNIKNEKGSLKIGYDLK